MLFSVSAVAMSSSTNIHCKKLSWKQLNSKVFVWFFSKDFLLEKKASKGKAYQLNYSEKQGKRMMIKINIM